MPLYTSESRNKYNVKEYPEPEHNRKIRQNNFKILIFSLSVRPCAMVCISHTSKRSHVVYKLCKIIEKTTTNEK